MRRTMTDKPSLLVWISACVLAVSAACSSAAGPSPLDAAADVTGIDAPADVPGVDVAAERAVVDVAADVPPADDARDVAADAPPALVAITLTPPSATIEVGSTQRFVPVAHYDDGTSAVLAGVTGWSSSQPALVPIDTDGLAHGNGLCTSVIQAHLGAVASAPAALMVVPSSVVRALEVTPPNALLQPGTEQAFTATATYADGHRAAVTALATWESSSEMIATVDARGVTRGVAVGVATITARIADGATPAGVVTGSATALVVATAPTRIEVTPLSATECIERVPAPRFTATAYYPDGSSEVLTAGVAWTSGSPEVATVDATGLTVPHTFGVTSIYATVGSFRSAGTLSVNTCGASRLAVTPARATLAVGAAITLVATMHWGDGGDQDVTTMSTWTSSDPAAATVDATGRVTALAPSAGVTLHAALHAHGDSATIVVNP